MRERACTALNVPAHASYELFDAIRWFLLHNDLSLSLVLLMITTTLTTTTATAITTITV